MISIVNLDKIIGGLADGVSFLNKVKHHKNGHLYEVKPAVKIDYKMTYQKG